MSKSTPRKIAKIFLSAIILTLVVVSIWPRVQNIATLSVRRNQLEKTKTELLLRNQQLYQDKEDLNDPAVLERLARERLGMTKEGEIVILPADR